MRNRNLLPRQSLFVAGIVAGSTGKDAALAAGYSARTAEKQASELLAKPHVRAEVDRLLNERNGRAVLTGAYVLDSLRDLAERLQTPEDWAPGPAIRALELLGKHLRLWDAPAPAVMSDDVRAFLDQLVAAVVENVSSPQEIERVIAAIEGAAAASEAERKSDLAPGLSR